MDKIKIIALGDTHMVHKELPKGDILIHTGDFCNYGVEEEVQIAFNWLNHQAEKFQHVIACPGNHDLIIERDEYRYSKLLARNIQFSSSGNFSVVVNKNNTSRRITIGTHSFTPYFNNWGYYAGWKAMEYLLESLEAFPPEIIVSHGPPYKILDLAPRGKHIGCKQLLDTIRCIEPTLHIFSHLHEPGHVKLDELKTNFYNCSSTLEQYYTEILY